MAEQNAREVVGGLSIGENPDPLALPYLQIGKLGISKLPLQITTKGWQMEQHFELMGIVKSWVLAHYHVVRIVVAITLRR